MLVTEKTLRTKETLVKELLYKNVNERRHNGPYIMLSSLNDGVTASRGEVHMEDYLKKIFK